MPTTRTPIRRPRRSQLPAEVIDLYRKARQLEEEGLGVYPGQTWREHNSLRWAIARALGRKPWMHSVLDAIGEPPADDDAGRDWHGAVALRAQLEASI
jgi:hypothetical protein